MDENNDYKREVALAKIQQTEFFELSVFAFLIIIFACFFYSCFQGDRDVIPVDRRGAVAPNRPLQVPTDLLTTTQPPQETSPGESVVFFTQPKKLGKQMENVVSKDNECKTLSQNTSLEESAVQVGASRAHDYQGHYSRSSSSVVIGIPNPPSTNGVNFYESSTQQQNPLFLANPPTTSAYAPVYNYLLKDTSSNNLSQKCRSKLISLNFLALDAVISPATSFPIPNVSLTTSDPPIGSCQVLSVPFDTLVTSPSTSTSTPLNIPVNVCVSPICSSSTLKISNDPTIPSVNSSDVSNIHLRSPNHSSSFSSANDPSPKNASRLLFYRNCKVDLQDIGVADATEHPDPISSPEPEAPQNRQPVFCADCVRRGVLENHRSDDESDDEPKFVDSEGYPKA